MIYYIHIFIALYSNKLSLLHKNQIINAFKYVIQHDDITLQWQLFEWLFFGHPLSQMNIFNK